TRDRREELRGSPRPSANLRGEKFLAGRPNEGLNFVSRRTRLYHRSGIDEMVTVRQMCYQVIGSGGSFLALSKSIFARQRPPTPGYASPRFLRYSLVGRWRMG